MKKEPQFKVIFDVRSSSVGFGIVEFSPVSNPKIIYSDREYVEFTEEQTGENFISTLLSALQTGCDKVVEQGMREVRARYTGAELSGGYIFYSSPWYLAHIKEVIKKKDKPFVFKEDDFDRFVEEELGTHTGAEDTVVIEKDITHVRINGYEIENPFNKKVKELSAAFYVSEMNKGTYQLIQKMLENSFPDLEFIHKTHTLALFSTLRDLFPHNPTFMFLDIGGEITDLGVVEHNSLIHSVHIPFGQNYVLREATKGSDIGRSELISKLDMVYDGEVGGKEKDKIEKVLGPAKENWLMKIKEAVKDMKVEVPKHIFLGSDKEFQLMFKKFLLDPNLAMKEENQTVMNNVIILDNSTFNQVISYGPKVRRDTFLEVEAFFLHNNKLRI